MGLSINESKTKYMEVTNNPTNIQYLSVKEYKFEKVTQFKHEDGCLLGCNAMQSRRSLPMFQRSLLPPSSG
jgi:hypothetical protein